MKRIDRLIARELFGPWLFGVGLFTVLLLAATYLGRITGFVVAGVPLLLVLKLFGLLTPAMLAKTFTMSVLLAALLGFGRLSSDSEIVALRAAGASIPRIVLPVALFSLVVAGLTFWFNEAVVPPATYQSEVITEQIVRDSKFDAAQPFSQTVVRNGRLRLGIIAENVNPAEQVLQGVIVLVYDRKGNLAYYLRAPRMQFTTLDDWKIEGGADLESADHTVRTHLEGDAWPDQLPKLDDSFHALTKERSDDFDAMSFERLGQSIQRHTRLRDETPSQIANLEYGYWNKLAVPLAAIVFGIMGAVLGIRNHRTSTAAGFALAIAIIFCYVTLANFMSIWAMGGLLPPYMASFAPLALGLVVSGVIMKRKNA